MKWIVGSATHGCWIGTYELDKQRALRQFVKTGMTVYDIGAQAGFYTLFFSRLVGQSGKVYAFEPFAENIASLISHVRMNAIENITVVQVAVADKSGLGGFTVDCGKHENGLTRAQGASLLVATVGLDEAVHKHGVALPDLIKMDVEGSEAAVLEGARRILVQHRPVVFIALHGEEQRRACQSLLEQMQYQLHDLSGARIAEDFETDEVYALPRGEALKLGSHRASA
jgi:FkbM family methyltransferase